MQQRRQSFGKRVVETVKDGGIDGGILYLASKVQFAGATVAGRYVPKEVPQEITMPVVGLLLATLTRAIVPGAWGSRIATLQMASGVAMTLQFAGNGGTGLPGSVDQAVNKVFEPIMKIGATAPTPSTNGYIPARMAGYLVQSDGTLGYIKSTGALRKSMRGYITEKR